MGLGSDVEVLGSSICRVGVESVSWVVRLQTILLTEQHA